eukprot:7230926-Pyramimonas_sp.AAC.1
MVPLATRLIGFGNKGAGGVLAAEIHLCLYSWICTDNSITLQAVTQHDVSVMRKALAAAQKHMEVRTTRSLHDVAMGTNLREIANSSSAISYYNSLMLIERCLRDYQVTPWGEAKRKRGAPALHQSHTLGPGATP